MIRTLLVCIITTVVAFAVLADVAPSLGGSSTHSVSRRAVVSFRGLPDSLRMVACSDTVSVMTDSATFTATTQVFAVPSALLDAISGVDSLRSVLCTGAVPRAVINLYPLRVSSNSSLTSETVFYVVDGVSDGQVVLRLTKRVLTYDDGGDDITITY
jgi:hypothetical protein